MNFANLNPGDMAACAAAFAAVFSAIAAFMAVKQARRSANAEESAHRLGLDREVFAQSRMISAYEIVDPEEVHLFAIRNDSNSPVYEVGAFLTPYGHEASRPCSNWGFFHRFAILPPGLWDCQFQESVRGMSKIPGLELAFTDAAGRHWVRYSSGGLMQTKGNMIETYGVTLPFTPTPLTPHNSR